MGTPRVSDPANQMSRVQSSASVSGECNECSAIENPEISRGRGCATSPFEMSGAKATKFCCCELVVANGCTGSVVRFCDVSQQDLLAQQAGAHAFLLGAFTKMHADGTGRSDATNIAATNTSEAVTLPTISCFLARLRPNVEARR